MQESSNGCASGGCLVEAVYHGLMEVVERDAFLLAWYGRAAAAGDRPRAPAPAPDPAMVDRLAMYGYRARFFDTRITFHIPVVTAVAVRLDGGFGRLCFGAGASLDPEAAIAAGLCEIATDAVNCRAAARAGTAARHGRRLRPGVGLHDHPLLYGLPEMGSHASFLLGAPAAAPRSLAEAFAEAPPRAAPPPTCATTSTLRRGGDRAGFDVIVVDQTTPEQRDLGLTRPASSCRGSCRSTSAGPASARCRCPGCARRPASRRLDRDLRDARSQPGSAPLPLRKRSPRLVTAEEGITLGLRP